MYPRFPVGAVGIIKNERDELLLLRQTYHRDEQWGAPGGWVDAGEAPRQAVEREVWEETGLRVVAGRVLAIGSGGYGEVTMAFACSVVGDDALYLSDESDRAGYFDVGKLPALPTGHRRLIEEAFAHDR